MGFFDSVSKGLANAAETGIKTNWDKMRRMERDQLTTIYETKGLQDTIGVLAYLMLSKEFSAPELYGEDKDNLEHRIKSNTFLMGEGNEFDEIRKAIAEMKKRY